MQAKLFFICALLLFSAGAARAQQPDQDPIGQSLFPPELVFAHQEAIGLSDEQRDYLKTEIRQAQLKFTEDQWKLQDEMEKMAALIKQPRVDEQQALAQLEKVLAAEKVIKREQVTLLVRIKNKLTPEQQAKLSDLRTKPAEK
ncbi:MAG TPA: periplasmic heavy metal sensor [Candidatus Acidoferrales bacterium]